MGTVSDKVDALVNINSAVNDPKATTFTVLKEVVVEGTKYGTRTVARKTGSGRVVLDVYDKIDDITDVLEGGGGSGKKNKKKIRSEEPKLLVEPTPAKQKKEKNDPNTDGEAIENGLPEADYKKIRRASPSTERRNMVNPPSRVGPHKDPALGNNFIADVLEADHIVSLKEISKMSGFNRLTFEQQKYVANYRRNFIGLTKSGNASKGANDWTEWWGHKKSGTPVKPSFRRKMLKKERKVKYQLQKLIDDFLKEKE